MLLSFSIFLQQVVAAFMGSPLIIGSTKINMKCQIKTQEARTFWDKLCSLWYCWRVPTSSFFLKGTQVKIFSFKLTFPCVVSQPLHGLWGVTWVGVLPLGLACCVLTAHHPSCLRTAPFQVNGKLRNKTTILLDIPREKLSTYIWCCGRKLEAQSWAVVFLCDSEDVLCCRWRAQNHIC